MDAVNFHGYTVHADGWIEQKRSPGRQVLPYEVKGGYLRVTLTIDGQRRGFLVHVLVAECFRGPKPDGHEVNHVDGDKTHNAASNLEYVTPSANVRHSLDHLGVQRAKGSRNGAARLTEAIVREMRERASQGEPVAALAREFNVNTTTAHRAIVRTNWRHVS